MARKMEFATALPDTPPVILEIEGMREIKGPFDDTPATFEITGLTPIPQIDFAAMQRLIEDTGIPERDAIMYTEELCETIRLDQLSKAIAKRMKRVG